MAYTVNPPQEKDGNTTMNVQRYSPTFRARVNLPSGFKNQTRLSILYTIMVCAAGIWLQNTVASDLIELGDLENTPILLDRDTIALIKSIANTVRGGGGRLALNATDYSVVKQLTKGTPLADSQKPSLALPPPYIFTHNDWLVFINRTDADRKIMRRDFVGIPITDATRDLVAGSAHMADANAVHQLLHQGYLMETNPSIRLIWLEHWVGAGADTSEEWMQIKSVIKESGIDASVNQANDLLPVVIGVAADGPAAFEILGKGSFFSLFDLHPPDNRISGRAAFNLRRLALSRLVRASKEEDATLQNLRLVSHLLDDIPRDRINFEQLQSFIAGVMRSAPSTSKIDKKLLELWREDVPVDFQSRIFGILNRRLPSSDRILLSQGEVLKEWDQEFAENKSELKSMIASKIDWWWKLDEGKRSMAWPQSKPRTENAQSILEHIKTHGSLPVLNIDGEIILPSEDSSDNP
jgi:hypothetical protein